MMVNRTLLIAVLAACTGQFRFPGVVVGSSAGASPVASPSPRHSSAPSRTADAGGGDPDTTPPRGFPAWCAGHRGSTETGYLSLKNDLGNDPREAEGWFSVKTIRHLAQASCAWRNSDTTGETAKIQAIYHQRRAELMKLAQLSDAETDELLAASLDEQKERQGISDFCGKIGSDEQDGVGKLTTKDEAERNAHVMMACAESQSNISQYDWPDASEILKFYMSGRCLASVASSVDPKALGGVRNYMEFGVCNAIFSHVDASKLDAEIKQYPSLAREWAKVHKGVLVEAAADSNKVFAAFAQKNAEWKPVLFDEPGKGLTAFMTAYTANKALFDKAKFLIENLKRHKVVAKLGGCEAEFWTPLAKLVAAKHPANVEAGADAMHDQTTYMLGRGLLACAELDNRADVVATFDRPLESAPVGSGPEQAVQWALIRYINAHADSLESEKLDSNTFAVFMRNDALDTRTSPSLNEIKGVVASVSPATSGWMKVTFKTESWMEDDFDCVETNKIDGIKSDGTLVYRQRCTFKGQSKHQSTEPPVVVEARFAGALKPGRLAELGETRNAGGEGERRAVPKLVRASKDAKAPMVGYLGFSW